MSVESVKVAESASRACSLQDSQTDPATFAAEDFDHLMHGEGSNGEGCHPFFEQLSRLNALLNNESAMVNNGPQIKQQIQSMITQGVESGLIDLEKFPESSDGSGVKMLTDRIGVDMETGAIQVRIGSDGDDNRFQALSTVSSKDMTAIGLEFSSFAMPEQNGISEFFAPAANGAEHPDQFTMTTPMVSEATQGQQNVSADTSNEVTAYSSGTAEVVTADPTAASAATDAAPESGAPAGAGGNATLPAEWANLAERLRNSEIPEEALQPGQPSQQATYMMSARRAEDLFERVQNGEMSKSNVNDLGHALQQMANVRLGLHVHSANRHELAELSRLASGQAGDDQWKNLSQAQRDEALAESMGMDTATWAKEVRPLIDQATQFHEMREDMSFKIDDAAKIVVAAAATYFTAGAASAGAFGAAFSTTAGSAFAGGFAGSFVSSGGDLGEAVEGGVTGAVTGGLLGSYGGSAADNMRTFGQNAAMRGIAEEVSGGDFEDGVMQEATNFAGSSASDFASGITASQFGQFAIEAGINGGLAELNGGDFADGVAATATDYVPYLTDGMAESMNIQPGTWQQVAFDAVVSGATAEFTGGDFEDGFRSGAARGLQNLADGNLAEQLEVDNPYLATLMDAGLNGAAAEISGGDFEDGLRYTAMQQLPQLNAALHEKFDAEEGSVLSAMLTAGVTGVGYELADKQFADGFWNSAAGSLSDYVDNMDMPENSTARMLIEAGAAGVESEMRGGEFGDSFLRVIGSHTSGVVGEQYGETAGVATDAFLNRLIENDGDVGDALMAAGQAGLSQYRSDAAATTSADDAIYDPAWDFGTGNYSGTPGINPTAENTDNEAGFINVGTGYLDVQTGQFSPHMANAGSVAVNPVNGSIDVVTADGTTTEVNSGDLAESFRDMAKNLASRANVGIGLMLYSSELGNVDTYAFTNADGSASEQLSDLRIRYDGPMGIGSIQKQLDSGEWIDSGYQVRREGQESNSPFIIVSPGGSGIPGYGVLDESERDAISGLITTPNNGAGQGTTMTTPIDQPGGWEPLPGYAGTPDSATVIEGPPLEPISTADDFIILSSRYTDDNGVPVRIGHIIDGETRRQKATGFHHMPTGQPPSHVEIVDRGNTDVNGIYEMRIKINGREKSTPSTMFPDTMTEQEIVAEIRHAYQSALENGDISSTGYFTGSSTLGFEIHGYVADGKILTAWPIALNPLN